MLSFVDLPKGIRVVRVVREGDSITRAHLGRIPKNTLEVDHALAEQLDEGEREELEQIVSGYAEAELLETRALAMKLPIILRSVMEYMEGDATETERRFITSAMVEAIRRIRKYEREGAV